LITIISQFSLFQIKHSSFFKKRDVFLVIPTWGLFAPKTNYDTISIYYLSRKNNNILEYKKIEFYKPFSVTSIFYNANQRMLSIAYLGNCLKNKKLNEKEHKIITQILLAILQNAVDSTEISSARFIIESIIPDDTSSEVILEINY
jgi:hypothetical protein